MEVVEPKELKEELDKWIQRLLNIDYENYEKKLKISSQDKKWVKGKELSSNSIKDVKKILIENSFILYPYKEIHKLKPRIKYDCLSCDNKRVNNYNEVVSCKHKINCDHLLDLYYIGIKKCPLKVQNKFKPNKPNVPSFQNKSLIKNLIKIFNIANIDKDILNEDFEDIIKDE